MVDVDVIRAVCVVAHDNTVSTSVLVGSLYGVSVPIGPKHRIFKQGQSENMRQGARYGPVSVLSIHIGVTIGNRI